MGPSKEYVIDDILEGYNNYDKLRKIYADLRQRVLVGEPIQSSSEPFITLKFPNWRSGNYGWELYSVNGSSLVLEYFGRWSGYANEMGCPPGPKEASLHHMRLTIHNSKPALEQQIGEILSQYPRDKS